MSLRADEAGEVLAKGDPNPTAEELAAQLAASKVHPFLLLHRFSAFALMHMRAQAARKKKTKRKGSKKKGSKKRKSRSKSPVRAHFACP